MEGTPFGRYRLVDELGRGGMGEVWRAFDTVTERVVAIKVLPAGFADDHTYQTRFRREAKAAAGLNDPHVVPIHDFGEIDGRLFVTMRLVDGEDLQAIIDRGRLSPERAVAIIEQVAMALDDAHRIDLVHRDVKPHNILVTRDDFAYLIDFGIARAAGETALTSAGAMIGTLAYMSPERFQTGLADARADTYALTVVLYEALTGQLPYPAVSIEQIAVAHIMHPPPRPSAVYGDIPPAFDDVIAIGMAKDPGQRYPTTRDLAIAARAAINDPIGRFRSTVAPLVGGVAGPPPTTGPPTMQRPTVAPSVWQADPTSIRPQPYRPPPNKGRRLLIGLSGIAAIVAVVAAVALWPSSDGGGVKGPTSTVAQPSSTSTTTVPPPPPLFVPPIETLLLPAADMSRILNTPDLVAKPVATELVDTETHYVPEECDGIVSSGSIRQFGGTNFTAMREQVFTKGLVLAGLDVFQYETPEKANQVLDSLAPQWNFCRGKTVTQNPGNFVFVIDDLGVGDRHLNATLTMQGESQRCLRVIQPASVFVLDVLACGPNLVDDRAQAITSEMAAKAKG